MTLLNCIISYLTFPISRCLSRIALNPSIRHLPTNLALDNNCSFFITSNTAIPIAHATGLPPNCKIITTMGYVMAINRLLIYASFELCYWGSNLASQTRRLAVEGWLVLLSSDKCGKVNCMLQYSKSLAWSLAQLFTC